MKIHEKISFYFSSENSKNSMSWIIRSFNLISQIFSIFFRIFLIISLPSFILLTIGKFSLYFFFFSQFFEEFCYWIELEWKKSSRLQLLMLSMKLFINFLVKREEENGLNFFKWRFTTLGLLVTKKFYLNLPTNWFFSHLSFLVRLTTPNSF